ncbi:hypothetical protein H9P43_002613 [Blastocladiella emersonii ATCC 22665]|nr:hypothetical protein H9P43_002613 [Blastocladiella emersonii ATCC 22665]
MQSAPSAVRGAPDFDAVVSASSELGDSYHVGYQTKITALFRVPPTAQYTMLVDWGETSASGEAATSVFSTPSTAAQQSLAYVYRTTGTKIVTVTLTDGTITPLTSGSPASVKTFKAVDLDGTPSKTLSLFINVQSKPMTCATFDSTVSWSMDSKLGLASADVTINVVDPQGIVPSRVLAQSMIVQGHYPDVVLRNDTMDQTLTPVLNTTDRTWRVHINSQALVSASLVYLELSATGASALGCNIAPSVVSISPAAVNGVKWGIAPLASPALPSAPVTALRLVPHPCRKSHAFAFTSPTTNNQVLHTLDSWATWRAFSLSSLCANCTSFTVYDIGFGVRDVLLVATSNGLYQMSTALTNVVRVTTGIAAIDQGTAGALLFGRRSCYAPSVTLYSARAAYWLLLSSAHPLHSKWLASAAFPSGATVVDTFTSDLSVVSPLALLKLASNTYSIVNATTASTVATLPSDATPSLGIFPHVDEYELHAVGSHVLASSDGGTTWRTTMRVPSTLGGAGTAYASCRHRNAYAVLTPSGTILYGRAGVALLTPISASQSFAGSTGAPPASAVLFDLAGNLIRLDLVSLDGTTLALQRTPVSVTSITQSSAMYDINPAPIDVHDTAAAASLGYVPAGIDQVTLRALSATGAAVANAFTDQDQGQLISILTGGTLFVSQVATDGASAYVQELTAITPLAITATAMDVRATGATVAGSGETLVDLVLTSSSAAWDSRVVGSTVVVNSVHAVFVLSVTDAQTVRGMVISSLALTLPISGTTRWKVVDLRARPAAAMSYGQSISVAAGTATAGSEVSLSTQSGKAFAFAASMLNSYVSINGGAALLRITRVASATAASALVVTAMAGLAGSSFDASQVAVFAADYVSSTYLQPRKTWSVVPPACSVRGMDIHFQLNNVDLNHHPVEYLASFDQLQLRASWEWAIDGTTIPPKGATIGTLGLLLTQADYYATTTSANSSLDRFAPTSAMQIAFNNIDATVSTALAAVGENSAAATAVGVGVGSTVGIMPSPMSIACPFTIPTMRVINGCHPSYRLFYNIPNSDSLELRDDLVFPNGASMITYLPTNYRPPSALGVGVPNSTYIYNADPSAPRYNDFFPLSKSTGSYHTCAGKANRTACGCSDAETRSFRIEDSDCITRVLSAYQQADLPLSFFLTRDMDNFSPVAVPFTIVELNNRADWCISSFVNECAPPNATFMATADPTVNASLVFKGAELYHFRVFVPIGSYCTLATDMPVFVLNATPIASVQQSTMSLTAVTFCFWLLAIYLWYSYKQV